LSLDGGGRRYGGQNRASSKGHFQTICGTDA
jgi:hypothetical protein